MAHDDAQAVDALEAVDAVDALSEQMVRLTRASHAMRVQLAARGDEGIDWAAYTLLFHLVSGGPQRASGLADIACVDPSTVSRQVADLVRAGLVERVPDPEDGRAQQLVATAAGQALYAARRERRVRTFARIVEGWDEQDVRALTELVARFNDRFAALRPALLDELASDAPGVEEATA
jgi:DNA-binding MarR family transcriptional regulator